jgi:hypothetical protein
MAASTAVAVYGAVQAGKAQKQAADYNAQVAQQNAKAAQQQGAAAAEEQQRQLAQKIGSIQANVGASGVASDSGSALDSLTSSVQQGTLDQLTTKYNYALKGAGYTDTSNLDLFQGENAQQQGYMNAASSALNGASGMYYQSQKTNVGYGLGGGY